MSRTPTPSEEARSLLHAARAAAWEQVRRREPLTPARISFSADLRWGNGQQPPSSVGLQTDVSRSWPDRLPRTDDRRRLLLGVTTFDRAPYLDGFLESFDRTRTTDDEWWVVIADDGSRDGSREVAATWADRVASDVSVVRVQNHATGIAGQTNSILQCVLALDPDLAFIANDDIEFLQAGWADAWCDAVRDSGFEHLVLFDEAWRDPVHEESRPGLRSLTDARGCMGAFYTLTPDLVRRIGFFDEDNFPVRGHSHIDWTVRACRAGANEDARLWEVEDATSWGRLRSRDDYLQTFDWKSEQARRIFTPDERQRRMDVIDQEDRLHIPLPTAKQRSRVLVSAEDPRTTRVLMLQPRLAPSPTPPDFDATFVLNLRAHVDRWDMTAVQLASAGLDPVRTEATYGFAPEYTERWQRYADRGLELPIEREIGRRLIQNPGAFGYLLSMERVLAEAISKRYETILLFDDDVHADRSTTERIAKAVEHLPEGWLLWYLGSSQKNWAAASEPENELYDTGGKADGSFAVAVSSEAFGELLESTRRFDWPFDAGPLRQLCTRHSGRVVASFPPIFVPDVSDSIIRHKRDMESFAKKARWPLSRYRERAQPEQRTTVIVTASRSRADAVALVSTLDGLRRQDVAGQAIHVIAPAGSSAARELVEAQVRDTRVTGWTCPEAVGPEELNTLVDLCRPASLLLLSAGDVLPRDGMRRLRDHLATSPTVSAVSLPAVVTPSATAAEAVDDPELPRWSASTTTGPTLFGPLALRVLGDVEATGAAGAAVWLRRLRDRGDETAVCTLGQEEHGSWPLRTLATVEEAEQAAAAARRLPPASLERPLWGRPRAPLTRLPAPAPTAQRSSTEPEPPGEVRPAASQPDVPEGAAPGQTPRAGSELALLTAGLVGLDYCGSSVINAALGSLPDVWGVGESHWIIDRELSCRECGDHPCPRFTEKALYDLRSGGATDWWQRLSELGSERVLLSSDKAPHNYDRLGVPDVLIWVHKDPAAHIASKHKRLTRDGKGGPEAIREAIDWYVKQVNRRVQWTRQTGRPVVLLKLDALATGMDEALRPVQRALGLPGTHSADRFWEQDLHYIGGNFRIRARGRMGGFDEGIRSGREQLDDLPAIVDAVARDDRVGAVTERVLGLETRPPVETFA